MSDMIKLTGMWKGQDKNGNDTFSGNFNATARVVMFANNYKEKETDPDMILYMVPNKPKEGQ